MEAYGRGYSLYIPKSKSIRCFFQKRHTMLCSLFVTSDKFFKKNTPL
jgi:hypothetical protein